MDWADFAVFFIIVLCVVWLISILIQDNRVVRETPTVLPKELPLPAAVLRYRDARNALDARNGLNALDEDFIEAPPMCPCGMRMHRCGGWGRCPRYYG